MTPETARRLARENLGPDATETMIDLQASRILIAANKVPSNRQIIEAVMKECAAVVAKHKARQ